MELYSPDQTDRDILTLLQKDARLTYKELAAILHLSKSPIQERVKRLERLGLISAIVALIDPDKFDNCMICYLQVQLTDHSVHTFKLFQQEVSKFQEVLECYHTTGGFDFMLKVVARNMNAYNDFLINKFGHLENIGTVSSSLVITQVKRETALPV
jgi:Lrp/AsnC family transcriptional regulator, leucine-responsive regulatory protein